MQHTEEKTSLIRTSEDRVRGKWKYKVFENIFEALRELKLKIKQTRIPR